MIPLIKMVRVILKEQLQHLIAATFSFRTSFFTIYLDLKLTYGNSLLKNMIQKQSFQDVLQNRCS